MKKILLIISFLALLTSSTKAQLPDLPSGGATTYNVQNLPAGSYVIAMDNTNQGNGTIFNMKAYGLVVYLLNNNVKLKWVIKPGKAKDANDFSVNASRIKPTAGAAATFNFKAGPFVIFASDITGVAALIDAYNAGPNTGTDVNVYQTNAAVAVDVRYDMTGFKPKAAILNDGTNSAIHTGYMTAASIPASNYALETTGANLLTNCYTFASEPHNTSSTSTLIGQIRTFVQNGGNFLAQCEAVRTYENEPVNGRFQSTRGDAAAVFEKGAGGNTNATINTNIAFPNPDLAYSQFEGSFDGTLTGSLRNWRLTSGSSYTGNTHDHAEGSATPAAVSASAVKLLPSNKKGGMVYYLGNHEYDVSDQVNANGMRMYMNAFLTPTDLLGSLQFVVLASCMTNLASPTIVNVNINAGPSTAYPVVFDLYADITAPFGQQNVGDVFLGTASVPSQGSGQQIIVSTDPYRRNTPYVVKISPNSGCLQPVDFIPNLCIVTLPVSLKSFTAVRNQSMVDLTWVTATEQNNKGFQVERLTSNSGSWETVGFADSKAVNGNSSSDLSYSFSDYNASRSVSQYRLRQIDLDNNAKLSDIRTVRGLDQKSGIIIYPNPTIDGRVNLVFENRNAVRDISVTDMSGRIIRQIKAVTATNIMIENLTPGMYTVRVFTPSTGEQIVEKIIVNKR